MDMLNITGLIASGAIISVIVTCWSYIKAWSNAIIGLMIETNNLYAGQHFQAALIQYILKKKHLRLTGRYFTASQFYLEKLKRSKYLIFEKWFGTTIIVFPNSWIPILIYTGKQFEGITVYHIRRLFDMGGFIKEVRELEEEIFRGANLTAETRFKITYLSGKGGINFNMGGMTDSNDEESEKRLKRSSANHTAILNDLKLTIKSSVSVLGEDPGDLFGSLEEDPMRAMFLPKEFDDIYKEISRWKKSKDWYETKGLSWTRGWLFHGEPGSGKSSLISATCRKLDLPIYVFDLSSMTNQELSSKWDEISYDVPAVVLFEDFDNVFNKRVNENATDMVRGVTFDHLLNVLSGVQKREGIFLMVTVNDISRVDHAIGLPDPARSGISSRPGRIDRVIKMPVFDEDCRIRMAKHILSEAPELIDETVAKGEGFTGSQFKEMCAQLALSKYWEAAEISGEDDIMGTDGDQKEMLVRYEPGYKFTQSVANEIYEDD